MKGHCRVQHDYQWTYDFEETRLCTKHPICLFQGLHRILFRLQRFYIFLLFNSRYIKHLHK